uniref:Uncharacterized protein n=1 Tax=Myotis myotis TaxID=51298 RepID=A0A7J7QWQ0_MYOMY|nr:hypothetical protein mMyoMyo1_011291 [Myotis myotis]
MIFLPAFWPEELSAWPPSCQGRRAAEANSGRGTRGGRGHRAGVALTAASGHTLHPGHRVPGPPAGLPCLPADPPTHRAPPCQSGSPELGSAAGCRGPSQASPELDLVLLGGASLTRTGLEPGGPSWASWANTVT